MKSVDAVLRNPSANVVEGISGPLKKYILSELNAWDFTVVPKEEHHDWVTLSLTPDFKVLGKKLGKKMKTIGAAIKNLSHDVSTLVVVEILGLELQIALSHVSQFLFCVTGSCKMPRRRKTCR